MRHLKEITAPYNFVPLSSWIYYPTWGNKVTQDIPFKQGLSGVLDVTLTAHSPLLVGQKQIPATKKKPGEVHFFTSGDHYAIPGSSLKGMVRNVLEIASFSKMRMVDDERLGIRDITGGGHLRDIYSSRMQDQKAGYLRLSKSKEGQDKVAEIIPCDFAHIKHNDLKKRVNYTSCLFSRGQNVSEKYRRWAKLSESINEEGLPTIRFSTQRGKNALYAKPEKHGDYHGDLVFTGQISDKCQSSGRYGRVNKSGKYRDFVFYNKKQNVEPLSINAKTLADFRKIHGENTKKLGEKDKTADERLDGSWNNFWRERFERGEAIPVFYHQRGNSISIGLAFMYKLAYQYSIGETIAHTNPFHHYATLKENNIEAEDQYDLAEILFGTVDPDHASGGSTSKSLKSRISFGQCQGPHRDTVKSQHSAPTILNAPKASYFPSYLQQKASNNQLFPNKPYSTYMDHDAEIRGWKRYPVRPVYHVKTQALEGKQKDNHKVQVVLNPLPAGTEFKGKIHFHNLLPQELGALFWVLQWGKQEHLRHSLGMGKPFGYGQVSFSLKKAVIFHNEILEEKTYQEEALKSFVQTQCKHFETEIEQCYSDAAKAKQTWKESPQIRSLLTMANPKSPLATSGKLKSMTMGMSIAKNDFVQAKTNGLVLPSFDDVNSVDQVIFPPKTLQDYLREKEEKQSEEERLREQQKEAARVAALSPLERSIEEVIKASKYGEILALITALESNRWETKEEQGEVAEYVRKRMQEKKQWKEKSATKNPRKDKPYQNTLRVLKYL